MTTQKEEAEVLLAQEAFPSAEIAWIASYLEDIPKDNQGDTSLEALYMRMQGPIPKITSRKIRNILFNWQDMLYGMPNTVTVPSPFDAQHPTFYAARQALKALQLFIGAMNIQLSDDSARIVKILWVDHKDKESLPIMTVQAELGDEYTQDRIDALLANLHRLGVIRLVDGTVEKRERFVLLLS